jgi:hypothetical protein
MKLGTCTKGRAYIEGVGHRMLRKEKGENYTTRSFVIYLHLILTMLLNQGDEISTRGSNGNEAFCFRKT